jgi:hypothetical protein
VVGADALLAAHHQVNSLEHQVERHAERRAGMPEHGANLNRELLAALGALFKVVANPTVGFFTLRLPQTLARS